MDRRHFLRTHAPAARFGCRPDDDDPRRLALAQGFAPMDALAWRGRVSPRRGAGRARRIARDPAHGFAGHLSRDHCATVFRADLRARAVHQPVVERIGAPASGTARRNFGGQTRRVGGRRSVARTRLVHNHFNFRPVDHRRRHAAPARRAGDFRLPARPRQALAGHGRRCHRALQRAAGFNQCRESHHHVPGRTANGTSRCRGTDFDWSWRRCLAGSEFRL